MQSSSKASFDAQYQLLLKHLIFKGLLGLNLAASVQKSGERAEITTWASAMQSIAVAAR